MSSVGWLLSICLDAGRETRQVLAMMCACCCLWPCRHTAVVVRVKKGRGWRTEGDTRASEPLASVVGSYEPFCSRCERGSGTS